MMLKVLLLCLVIGFVNSDGIFIDEEWTDISIYDETTDKFDHRREIDEIDVRLDKIILNLKSEFKENLIKIYVVSNEILNVNFYSIADFLVHPLKIDDIDYIHYLPIKLTPDKKIVLVDNNSFLYEYACSINGVPEYKPVKCFEAPLDMENHLKLMLHFFECELNQLYFCFLRSYNEWDPVDNYLELIKKEYQNFSSYMLFTNRSNSEKTIIYGRYLFKSIQNLLKLQKCLFLSEIESNILNFKINKVIPSYRALGAYKHQTKLMGIDLGASRIVVCVSRDGRPDLVRIDREYSMPSVISFAEDEPVIGDVAIRHLARNPELVLFDLKHLRDTKRNLHKYSWRFGHCIEPKKSSFIFQSKKLFKQYSTVEIYQVLLQKLKKNVSQYQLDLNEGKCVNQAVITVPNFDNRPMLEDIFAAAESTGLKILDIITETHADLLYFLSKEEFSEGETVAIVDIGGGTGFIEKFSFEKGFHEKDDLSFLCGRKINEILEDKLRNLLYKRFKIWTTFNPKQMSEVEKIKENLSFEVELLLPPSLIQDEVLTKNWFEKEVMYQMLCLNRDEEIMETMKYKDYSSNISKVFLVGGTCRIPYIQELFKSIFGEKKVIIRNNLQEITATGALIHGLKVLNGEVESVFQRSGIEKQLDSNDSEDEPTDNKTETDLPKKTENEALEFSVVKDENHSIVDFDLLQLDERTDDNHKRQLPPK